MIEKAYNDKLLENNKLNNQDVEDNISASSPSKATSTKASETSIQRSDKVMLRANIKIFQISAILVS